MNKIQNVKSYMKQTKFISEISCPTNWFLAQLVENKTKPEMCLDWPIVKTPNNHQHLHVTIPNNKYKNDVMNIVQMLATLNATLQRHNVYQKMTS